MAAAQKDYPCCATRVRKKGGLPSGVRKRREGVAAVVLLLLLEFGRFT
jgi:hypothetical protein